MSVTPATIELPAAAKFLGMSPHTLRRWTAAGKVPCIRLDRKIRYSVEDLKDWLRKVSK